METMSRLSARAAIIKSSHAHETRALVPLVAIRFSCVRTIAWGLQRLMICLKLCNGQWLVFGLALGRRLTILEPSSRPATVLNAGKPVDPSRRHRGAFAQMRGDLKFLWDIFRWTTYNQNRCCHRCPAIKRGPSEFWYTRYWDG